MLESNGMPLNLLVPRTLGRALTREAKLLGLSLPEYALHVLGNRPAKMSKPLKTGADLVAYWQAAGVVGTRTDVLDSAQYARTLRTHAERRERPGA